jgi:hypothetical protein
MPLPHEIGELIERFERNADEYRSGRYNEKQLRNDFIDPFFEALGWDVNNKKGYAEAYRHVVHEDAIKVGGSTKAPDYGFYVGETRKFFVEAKKPSVNIKLDVAPAFQLRRYGWSAKLPLSILTNFDEFAVYDCRSLIPASTDKASTGRILYLEYKDYAERWDEIAEIFLRDAVLKGAFDKYAEKSKSKRGTVEVDDAFLQEIEAWRKALASNIYLRNPHLNTHELNSAVGLIIDRIIFLRICEDRGIEPDERLQKLIQGKDVYSQLLTIFYHADQKYNSGLFHFDQEKGRVESRDTLTPTLTIDDKVLKKIFESIYLPLSPYAFIYFPPDVLGQVYEQFLGKVIRLTAHRAEVEDKPEVRKAGGVYYTPSYIVDYIVKQAVGQLCEGKTPEQVDKLRILDPACGSGSFLINAYQYLLDWYLKAYRENEAKKYLKRLRQDARGEWRLTTAEKRRILLQNIYGVDIDAQAVEVTKLSLLLKVLEGESERSLAKQMTMLHERALPDLGSNIKCGNSLIGPDFYDDAEMSRLSDEEHYRINAFDWELEFAAIMQAGGFDAVIGNPPYLRIQGLQEYYGTQIDYFIEHYESAVKRFDLYLLFAEKGFNLLNKNGRLGFICPHKFLHSDFGSGLREFLISRLALESFISFGNNLIFSQASTYTGILLLDKEKKDFFSYYEFPSLSDLEVPALLSDLDKEGFASYKFADLTSEPWTLASSSKQGLINKLRQQQMTIEDVFDGVFQGIVTGIDEIYFLKPISIKGNIVTAYSQREGGNVTLEKAILKPLLKGEDVTRYTEPEFKHYCIYPYKLVGDKTVILQEDELIRDYPLAYRYLLQYRNELKNLRIKYKTNPRYWYSCHRPRSIVAFESTRIITPEITLGCKMTLDTKGLYHNTTVYSLLPSKEIAENDFYWLGLLNSKVLWWYLANTGNVLRGGYFRFKTNYLNPFPVRVINFSDPADKARHDRMVEMVEQMLTLHKQLAAARTEQERTMLQRRIDATDARIDALVYELYGLTKDEIRIVEEATSG